MYIIDRVILITFPQQWVLTNLAVELRFGDFIRT